MQKQEVLEELAKLSLVHQVGQAAFLWSRTSGSILGLTDTTQQQQLLGGFLHVVCETARLSSAETAAAAYVVGLLTGSDTDAIAAARKTLCASPDERLFRQGMDEASRMLNSGWRH
jgi:hypothetical protein